MTPHLVLERGELTAWLLGAVLLGLYIGIVLGAWLAVWFAAARAKPAPTPRLSRLELLTIERRRRRAKGAGWN